MTLKLVGSAMAFMVLAGGLVRANVDANPYATIVDRNPFGLKPPPPPPPPPEQTAPPVPMAQVTLTGLLSTFGEPRVLLEIIEEPGKGGGTPKRPPPMREGERLGPVEVLSIDVAKNSVRLRNSGVETNVSFPVIKSTPTPGGPGIPGAPPGLKPPLQAQAPGQPQPGAPTVISQNQGGGGGVTLMGGDTGSASVPTALGSADGGMRSIPSRPLRTENPGGLPPMTKQQADLLLEANRLRGNIPPLPPTSLTPIFEGAQDEAAHGGQNQNPYQNQYQRRSGPPPIPGKQ